MVACTRRTYLHTFRDPTSSWKYYLYVYALLAGILFVCIGGEEIKIVYEAERRPCVMRDVSKCLSFSRRRNLKSRDPFYARKLTRPRGRPRSRFGNAEIESMFVSNVSRPKCKRGYRAVIVRPRRRHRSTGTQIVESHRPTVRFPYKYRRRDFQ